MPSHVAHDPVLAESAAVHTLTTQRGCAPEPGHAPTDARPPNCLTERKSEEGKNLAKHLAYLLTPEPEQQLTVVDEVAPRLADALRHHEAARRETAEDVREP